MMTMMEFLPALPLVVLIAAALVREAVRDWRTRGRRWSIWEH